MKRKINTPLIISVIILLIMLVIVLFPQWFTTRSPYNLNKLIFTHEDGELIAESAPFAPSKEFILGTDDMGRDIYTYIIYGTRLTIMLGVLVALGRFVIATPIAIGAGFGSKAAKGVIKVFSVLFSAVPAVFICIIILKIDFIMQLERAKSIVAFILVLAFVGWPKSARLIMERVEVINTLPFIKGEVAIGKSRIKIALENVLPHLAPELIVLQFMEIARSLAMIMTLGIFNVFVGNLKYVKSTDWGNVSFFNVSFEPEWASMLSTSRSLLGEAPWAVLFPALAFFISVLAFNLFGEGLRNIMQKKDSEAIPIIRKVLSYKIAELWRDSKKSSKLKLITALLLIIAVIFVPFSVNSAAYQLEQADSNEIPFNEVIIGTEQAKETAAIIAEKMQNLGIEPIKSDSLNLNYDIEPSVILKEYSVSFSATNLPISAELNKDYAFLSAGSFERSGFLYDATKQDLFNIDGFSKFEDKFIMIEKEYYEDAAIEYFIDEIQSNADINGILLVARYGEEVNNLFIEEDQDMFTMLVSKDFAQELKQEEEILIEVSTDTQPLVQTGTNIIGIYGEYNPEEENKAIMVGMNYNYLKEDGAGVLQFNLDLMKNLCESYDNQRSIIFVFIDGTLSERYNGLYSIVDNLKYSSNKIDVFIDLTRINKSSFESLEFSKAIAPFTRQFAWSIANQLDKSFNKKNMQIHELDKILRETEYYLTQSDAINLMFWNRGIATIVIGADKVGDQKLSVYEVGSVLLEVINKNGY